MKTVPEKYLVEGLKASGYNKLNDSTEAVYYTTPNGTRFALAKDFMGIQFCMGGRFWPPPFSAFPSMEEAVGCLKKSTTNAIEFFEKTRVALNAELENAK